MARRPRRMTDTQIATRKDRRRILWTRTTGRRLVTRES